MYAMLSWKKKQPPVISVIVPVYNVEGYLRECLDSVVGQSYTGLEILCIDDGSTDGSPGILAEYAEQDKRIKVVRQENGGVASARNAGLSIASGEYISFLDADDFFEPSLYGLMLHRAIKTKADICICQSDSIYDGSSERVFNNYAFVESLIPKKRVFSLLDIPQHAFSAFNGYLWDKLFRADFIERHHFWFYPTKASSDARFVHLAMATAKSISTVPKILVHHRKYRAGALTREKDYHSFYLSYNGLREDLKAAGLWERFEQPWSNRVLHTGLWYMISQDGAINREYFALLKDSWLEELGLWDKDESAFQSAEAYRCLQHIKEQPYEEFCKTNWHKALYGKKT